MCRVRSSAETGVYPQTGDTTPCRMTGVTLHTGLYPQTEGSGVGVLISLLLESIPRAFPDQYLRSILEFNEIYYTPGSYWSL